jgi:hypothetical protein
MTEEFNSKLFTVLVIAVCLLCGLLTWSLADKVDKKYAAINQAAAAPKPKPKFVKRFPVVRYEYHQGQSYTILQDQFTGQQYIVVEVQSSYGNSVAITKLESGHVRR